MKTITFLTPYYSGARGNVTTTLRLKEAYLEHGFEVEVMPYLDDLAKSKYLAAIQKDQVLHVLHITRFAQWLEQHQLPLPKKYIMTMGGTDIYDDIKHKEINAFTFTLLNQAHAIAFFTAGAKRQLLQALQHQGLQLNQQVELKVIPQGIILPPVHAGQCQRIMQNVKQIMHQQAIHLLVPAGLRQIKDIFFLREAWEKLASELHSFTVTVIGEALDETLTQEVLEYAQQHPFFRYLPAVPYEEMGNIYAQANIVLNTSINEGQPTAICEAMGLGLPVMVRGNEGNLAFVSHRENGLVFNSPGQFLEQLEHLTQTPELLLQICQRAVKSIEDLKPAQELRAYAALVEAASARK